MKEPNVIIRAYSKPYIVFTIIFFGFCWLAPLLMTGNYHRWLSSLAMSFVPWSGFMLYFAIYRLEMGIDYIKYRSMFGGSRTLNFKDIKSVKEEFGVNKYTDKYLPTDRLVIIPYKKTGKKLIVINQSAFDWPELSPIFERLKEQSKLNRKK